MLTQEELKVLVTYNPDTGIFTNNRTNKVIGYITGAGYVYLSIKNKSRLAHRLAWLYMTGELPKQQIDHINMVRTDNRFCNLRLANNAENNRNRSKQSNNTSGHKGICLCKSNPRKKWMAQLQVNGKRVLHKCFYSVEEATLAYQEAARRHNGEFFRC